MLCRTLPIILLLALALPVRAQNVVVDEGTFRIFDHGRDAGTETFAIRRVGQGEDMHIIANAIIELDLPGGHQQVKSLLRSGSDLSLSAYQVEVSGSDATEIAVTLSGRRFLTRTRSPTGELEREFRATPGAVVLDSSVAHQYWFLSRLAEGTEVTALVPRAGAQYRIHVLLDVFPRHLRRQLFYFLLLPGRLACTLALTAFSTSRIMGLKISFTTRSHFSGDLAGISA